jgi:NADPH:quinone reductase-like Zn-dependent oxidoreductase
MPLALRISRFGIGNLRLERLSSEPLGAGMVRVAFAVVSLNHRDLLVMRGTYGPDLGVPLIPCSDGAGVVVEVGDGADGLVPGERVCTHMVPDWLAGPLEPQMRLTTLGGPAQGVLCEERVLPIGAVVPIPQAMSFEAAACLPVAGLAAWGALTTEAQIGPGNHVLLSGTGGVSMMGLGIAKALGARVAITSSSDQKLARVAALGADLTVNYRRDGWAERVREWSGGGVDAVLDIGGAETLEQSVRAARDGGLVALLGVAEPGARWPDLAQILMRRIRLHGIFVGSRAELERYVAFVAAHRIAPVIDHVFDGLASARQAFAHLVTGRHLGKIVIRLASQTGRAARSRVDS